MAKTVGSNYSLQDHRLSVTLKNGFAALAAVGVAARRPPAAASISLLVSVFDKIRTYFKGGGG